MIVSEYADFGSKICGRALRSSTLGHRLLGVTRMESDNALGSHTLVNLLKKCPLLGVSLTGSQI